VLTGRVYLSGEMTSRMLHRSLGGEKSERSSIETLSSRELEVFELIGRGFTTGQIAGKLHRSVKTVEAHRESIKVKLSLSNSAQLTRRAVQWVLENS
jgi:DNA-binding NarL/FixJ family response regulator